ncbi:MAG: LysR family transcriptional regulator [Candidatus Odyssella sp.]|nr:LysR family transcriptional regulator [Candidatus Odyssella sp.]
MTAKREVTYAMDWDKLRVFHAVAEAGSFTHAGEMLRLSQSAVSRQISALEESLDTPLFHRHARGLVLTEQGEMLLRAVRDITGRLRQTEALITESKSKPEGPLRITCTTGLGATWLAPRIKEFVERYPHIDLTLILSDNDLDLTLREADVAIRVTPPTQPDLIRRNLMTIHFHVFGSTEYLKKHGIPKTAKDLDKHRLIVFGEEFRPQLPESQFLLTAEADPAKPRRPMLRVNSVYGIYQAMRSGLGLAVVPDYMSEKVSDVVRVLPEFEGSAVDAYFVYPEALRHSARVGVFREFLLQKIAETAF